MSDSYKLHVRWLQSRGTLRDQIDVYGPGSVIAAVLKELCEHPSFCLNGLASIEVKQADDR